MLRCKKCNNLVSGRDVNVQEMVATCPQCKYLFRFCADDLNSDSIGSKDNEIPARFRVEEQGVGWAVSWTWWRWTYLFLIFFCIFWDGFLVFWYTMGALSKNAPLMVFVFPIGHVTIGVALTYFVVAAALNRTVLSIKEGVLEIEHRPLPWFGKRKLPLSEVAELTVRENRDSEGQSDFALVGAINGKQRRLVGGLEEHESRWLLYNLKRFKPKI